ncbi:uncharacterized protein EV420DRAFT_1515877 [Desarmillaria tabescens]|uniref:F-box domain-containing protein n=1 Tax=Armillaria tabescens TaxID=1929756 RepID=A0AA39TV34_ARMTA|nr:uncharacterized protein EV420DRAFT_1515877 [Desarmillaria tabescens]KAK0464324.1 hypothetical protein EV420DRAFT_1515877 [Desarmillaria tabescens]
MEDVMDSFIVAPKNIQSSPVADLALEMRFDLEPHQKDLVKKLVLEAEQDMAHFEYNVRCIRENLVNYITQHKALLTPVSRLPVDILSNIFILLASTARNTVFDLESPPWVFTHVCRRWRNLARSTPELWSYVTVKDQQIGLADPYTLSSDRMAEEYFRLSKGAPLYIELGSRRNGEYSDSVLTDTALEYLAAHSMRWKTFKARLSLSDIAHLSITLPILESIDLVSDSEFDDEYPEKVRTFRDAPRLVKASLSELPPTTVVHLPKSLTSISFKDMPMNQIMSHLRGITHSLVSCEIRELDGPAPSKLISLRLPRLQSLWISFAHDFSLGAMKQHTRRFIGCLTLPALTELHVSGSVTLDVQIFTDLIRRSSCSIRSLLFECGDMFKLLRYSPNVTHLLLTQKTLERGGLKPLGYSSGDKKFILPKLDTLEIYATGFTEAKFKGVVQTIKSRFATNPQLQVFIRLGHQRTRSSETGMKEQDMKNQLRKATGRGLRTQFILPRPEPDDESDWDSESEDEYYLYEDSS